MNEDNVHQLPSAKTPRRVQWMGEATLDGTSYQSWPDTDAPYKVRGTIETAKTVRGFAICMTRQEAEDVVRQLCSFLGMTVTGSSTGATPIYEGS
jgi:hypothetical protein